MKSTIVNALAFTLMLRIGAYAQDTTAQGSKENGQVRQTEHKSRFKDNLKSAGQHIGEAAREVGHGAKEKAKVADEAVSKGAKKVGTAINIGLDKAESAILTEGSKLKARRDSSRAEKKRRGVL